jgi:hypothetical protein
MDFETHEQLTLVREVREENVLIDKDAGKERIKDANKKN